MNSLQQQQPYQRIRITFRCHHEPRQPKTLGLQAETDEQVVSSPSALLREDGLLTF